MHPPPRGTPDKGLSALPEWAAEGQRRLAGGGRSRAAMLHGMDRDQALDLEREMYWAVTEEASLGEVPLGVTDLDGEVRGVEHGPWEPAACSALLLTWFDDGLIELYDDREGHPTNRPDFPGDPSTRQRPTGRVPTHRARHLLSDWRRWGDGDELWLCTRLVLTDKGVQGQLEPLEPPSPTL